MVTWDNVSNDRKSEWDAFLQTVRADSIRSSGSPFVFLQNQYIEYLIQNYSAPSGGSC